MDEIDQVGETVIDAVARYFAEPHNLAIVEKLVVSLTIEDAERPRADTAVAGKTVVFTGSLERMTRDEAKAMAERLGRQGLGFGLEEDGHRRRRPGAGSKLAKAAEFGVRVLTEDEWLALVG